MTEFRTILSLCALAIGNTLACQPPLTAAFDANGYQNTKYGYRVAGSQELLGPNWKLDNLYIDEKRTLQPKKTDDYVVEYEIDTNGDGKSDTTEKAYLYDLRYNNTRRDAVIWVRTFPLSSDLRNKDLRVLMQRYIDEVAGAGFEAVRLNENVVIMKEKRYAASLVARGPLTIAGQQAYQAFFDVANVDDLMMNKQSRKKRVRVVLIRTPYWYEVRQADKVSHFPVLMLAGYANLPEDFNVDQADFRKMLEGIHIGDHTGMILGPLEKFGAAATADNALTAPTSTAAPSATSAPPSPASSGPPAAPPGSTPPATASSAAPAAAPGSQSTPASSRLVTPKPVPGASAPSP